MKNLISLLAFITALYSCGNTTDKETTVTEKACNNVDVAAQVDRAYLIETVGGFSKEEVQEWLKLEATGEQMTQGLTMFDVDTVYHAHCILGIRYNGEWMGAYPTSFSGNINYDLQTGDSLLTTDFIAADKMNELLAHCNTKLQQNIDDNRKTLVAGDGLEEVAQYLEQYPPLFTMDKINDYSISDSGVTWVYEIGFPHVMKGLEPDGHVTLSRAELQPLLKKDGPLGFMVQ